MDKRSAKREMNHTNGLEGDLLNGRFKRSLHSLPKEPLSLLLWLANRLLRLWRVGGNLFIGNFRAAHSLSLTLCADLLAIVHRVDATRVAVGLVYWRTTINERM